MVGGTNSMVVYHLMAEGHSVQLGIWGSVPPAVPGQCLGGGLEFFETFFEYRPCKDIWKAKIDTF